MFWNTFLELCSKRGVSPNAVAAELGKSSGSVTAWKNGTVPRETTLKKIADFFDVSVDFLIGREQKEKPSAGSEGLSDMQIRIIEKIKALDADQLERAEIAFEGIFKMLEE